MSILPQLSECDKAVLNSIFNPSLPLGEGVFQEEFEETGEDDAEIESKDDDDLVKMEISAIQMAEKENYKKSLSLFSKCIEISPARAATFNNRAQVYQLQGIFTACYEDLSKAIELSKGKGKVYCQALCQRGILYRKEGKDDEARIDFQKAAKLGSAFAKQQLIELNPYAALCNQMLSQVMKKLEKNE